MAIEPRPGFLPVDDYLTLPRESETFLIKPLIPISGAALLYGQEKTGKSSIAIQLAAALAGAYDNWMGFSVSKTGPVCYLQLDTPRSTWAHRFEALKKGGLKYSKNLLLADKESLDLFPFDILQFQHMRYLKDLVDRIEPVAVIVDTLRESHSGDEDNSTVARNVIANLVAATSPAALIIISHSRKPHPDVEKDLMADHRGSSYITGRMDAIMRMTKNKLLYGGRSIEEGSIKLDKMEVDGALMFEPNFEDTPQVESVMRDKSLTSLRAKGKALALKLSITEDAAVSRIRRAYPDGIAAFEIDKPSGPKSLFDISRGL